MDTKCRFYLIGIDNSPAMNHKKMMNQRANEIQLHIANGLTTVQNEVLLRVKNLREEVLAFVLDSAPPVRSIRKRYMDFGVGLPLGALQQAPHGHSRQYVD